MKIKKKKKNPKDEEEEVKPILSTHKPKFSLARKTRVSHYIFFFQIKLPSLATLDLKTRVPSLKLSFKASKC